MFGLVKSYIWELEDSTVIRAYAQHFALPEFFSGTTRREATLEVPKHVNVALEAILGPTGAEYYTTESSDFG